MQKLLLACLTLAHVAGLAAEVKTVVVKKETTAVAVKLDQTTVLCSSADYRLPFLKILIPQLAELTVLNHRNLLAGAPCVAAGECKPGNFPLDILPDIPVVVAPITVTLEKVMRLDEVNGQCSVSLKEHIEVPIRGKIFRHVRTLRIGERHIEDCR